MGLFALDNGRCLIAYVLMSTTIIHGECLEELKKLDDSSVDAVITDPPYGLSNTKPAQVADVLKAWVTGDTKVVPAGKGFMGASWDSFVPPPAVWEECMRVMKPGGHMAVFAGARTQDLMGLSIRLAGFEIRDTLGWVYGSGFPKSQNISLQIEKQAGKRGHTAKGFVTAGDYGGRGLTSPDTKVEHSPLTMDAAKWEGWGTALKPAIEPIILARKPLVGTVAANVLQHGVGGLNIDACRVAHDRQSSDWVAKWSGHDGHPSGMFGGIGTQFGGSPAGRFPANVLLDEHAAKEMDKQSGVSTSKVDTTRNGKDTAQATWSLGRTGSALRGHSDSGGASRFFPVFKYQAKAPKKERPVIEREDGSKVQHPTVKPVALMEWLVTLITPPGGTVLDPFAGSGTTLQAALNKGFTPIGIEQDSDYIKLIEQRLAA